MKVWILGLLLMLTLGAVFYFGLGRSAQEALVEQMLHRQQVVARSGSGALASFFHSFGRSLVYLSRDESIQGQSAAAQARMDDFVKSWDKGVVGGAILVDETGIVRFNSNVAGTPDTGADVSDRPYFAWAKEQSRSDSWDVFVGTPVTSRLGASQGQVIIPLAVPVYSQDEFRGVLAASIIVANLTRDFLDPLRISEATEIYLLNQDGTIILAPEDYRVGENIYEVIDQNPFLGDRVIRNRLEETLEKGGEGKHRLAVPKVGQDASLREMLVAYSFVTFDSQKWLLAIATPVEDALVYASPFYLRQLGLIVVMFIFVLGFAVVWSRKLGHSQAHAEDASAKTQHTS